MEKIITFGCRLNFYESELIKKELEKIDSNDLIIINSCAVTNEAERQVKQNIRKINRLHPDKKIIVVGCATQLKPDEYSKLPGVHKVLGNIEKLDSNSYTSNEKVLVSDIDKIRHQPVSNIARFTHKSRAFIQIQNGCDHDCTFCSITQARGRNRSIAIENIIAEIKSLVSNDYKEIILTGVDITDYGKDLFGKPSLSILIKSILDGVKNLPRLRLSSIDVAEIDDLFFDLFKNEERLMPHIHLSLQSGDAIILKRMKRRHSPQQILDFFHKITKVRSDIGFGADIIAGFPTETDEMFLNTYNLLDNLKIPYLHVFPFSPKSGTKAALMPQLQNSIIKERAKTLIKLGKQNLDLFHSKQINKIHKVVIEKNNFARAENFCLIKLEENQELNSKEIVNTKITSYAGEHLIGEII